MKPVYVQAYERARDSALLDLNHTNDMRRVMAHQFEGMGVEDHDEFIEWAEGQVDQLAEVIAIQVAAQLGAEGMVVAMLPPELLAVNTFFLGLAVGWQLALIREEQHGN